MGINLVTFAASTVTPQDDALIYETALLSSGLIYGGTVTIKSANVLRVAAGHGVLCGRKFTIEAMDVPVSLTASGTDLGRIYIHMDLSDTDEPISIQVETGQSLTPVQQDANVNITNGVYEINLATFDVDTSTISNLVNVAPVIDSVNNALTNKADVSTVTALSNTVTNNHKVTQFTVDTSSWTSDTTSQSGTTLYKKSIALNHVYVESPSVDIGSTGVLPTVAQQEAYNLLQYVTVDSAVPCLYLYASDIPTDAFYINVEGVD
jgi:hypothetical protein